MTIVSATAGLAACSDGGGSTAVPPRPSITSRRPPAASSSAMQSRCRVALPGDIVRSLRAQWARPPSDQVEPFDSTGPGDWDVAQVRATGFFGVAVVNVRTGRFRPVERFARPSYQALGVYNGRVAIWKETRSLYGLDAFSVKEWDAATGRVRTVGGSHRNPDTGRPYPSPWTAPTLGDGYAAWVEGSGDDSRGRLVVDDLATHDRRWFSTGHPGGASVVYRGALVWAESTRQGAPTQVFAKRLRTGRHTAPPPALAGQRGTTSWATDGTALAWVGSDLRSIWYAADGADAAPRLLVRLGVGGFNPPTIVRGPLVMSTDSDGVLVVNDHGVRTAVARGGGGVTGLGGRFLVAQPNPAKSATYPEGLAVIDPTRFASRACPDGS